jgi:hypothetical protein
MLTPGQQKRTGEENQNPVKWNVSGHWQWMVGKSFRQSIECQLIVNI